ncbi:IS200/IS605 family element transposase accessory protein TnpB [Picosynechococcus sp. PCC 11901]|uniref:RNA-guided endonuclease InsQ/TnpB family protein n=1 Tax=Picosynechococcus sp. PCC 11901 TaxID=2579791 RepID=UPI0010FBC531|nr:RNA-guided endonuclease TnpB family protein [Picosynechococcus sp. PCC 11901]QCS48436.1 IS200/IS605 family element transposase accessory protein TnpB [Picosynechococcus sp. PCC 11901]
MLILEFKVKGKPAQYSAIDEAIRTTQFIRNKSIRYWMDNPNVTKYDLNKQCAVLAKEFPFANDLNSQARQSAAERAWSAISRFYEAVRLSAHVEACKKKVSGKKGYPKFQKNCRSVEYKTSGWKLEDNRKYIVFTDKNKIGRLKLLGSRDLNFYQPEQIKRVRLVRRADGYYAQFPVSVDRQESIMPSGKAIGLDVGLKEFYTDSNGFAVENPRFLRKGEQRLKRAHRLVSRKQKGGSNRRKAINKLGRVHLKISRQRKDHAVKLARCVITSNDVVAYEDLRVKNLVKNHCLAKSINDASWYQFRVWLEYFGKVFGKITIAVPPHYTSQNCSACGQTVQKSLSVRTHVCECGCELDRDHNAAINILRLGLSTVGHTGMYALGDLTTTLAESVLSGQVESLSKESPRL